MRSKYHMIPPVRMTPEKEKMMDKVFKDAYSNKLKKISSEDLLQELINRGCLLPLGYKTFYLADDINSYQLLDKLEQKLLGMPSHEFHL